MKTSALVWTAGVCTAAVWAVLHPGRYSAEQRAMIEGVNHAHRGLHTRDRSVPENSLAAFRAAVLAGYGIELDIQLSQDGEVVVFHDDTLDRVCGVHGRVDAYPLAELRAMRLCGGEETIPLLREVLDEVNGKVPLIVELKSGPRNSELCEKALAILRTYSGPYCIESFDPRIVGWFKRSAPDILRGQLADAAASYKGQPKPLAFALSRVLMNVVARPQFIAYGPGRKPPSVRLTEAMGALRIAWTVHPEDDVEKKQAENDAVIFEFYRPATKY